MEYGDMKYGDIQYGDHEIWRHEIWRHAIWRPCHMETCNVLMHVNIHRGADKSLAHQGGTNLQRPKILIFI